MKKFLTVLGTVAAILALVWLGGRYGWKLFGFAACGGSGISAVSVTEDSVTVEGFYPGSFPAGCVGVISKQEGDTLYIGVRYDPLFGIFETGHFSVTVLTETPVASVCLKSAGSIYPVWGAADGSS